MYVVCVSVCVDQCSWPCVHFYMCSLLLSLPIGSTCSALLVAERGDLELGQLLGCQIQLPLQIHRIIQPGKDTRRSLAQPPAQSRVRNEIRPGCLELSPVRSWKCLWATCSKAWLSSWWKSLSSQLMHNGALLSCGWLNICLPMGSSEQILYFACTAFAFPAKLSISTHKFSH